jgi:hypothetical protein
MGIPGVVVTLSNLFVALADLDLRSKNPVNRSELAAAVGPTLDKLVQSQVLDGWEVYLEGSSVQVKWKHRFPATWYRGSWDLDHLCPEYAVVVAVMET